LVALTLLLPALGLTGSVNLISAIIFGAMLLYVAWLLWKVGGNVIAWKMYRYSSMYLAFLFFALVADALVT
jgi:protoheme IX farnesyltransferase